TSQSIAGRRLLLLGALVGASSVCRHAAADPRTSASNTTGTTPPTPAQAQPLEPPATVSSAPPAQTTATPRVHQAPMASAPQGERLDVRVDIEHPELVRSAVVVYRNAKGKVAAAVLQRAEDGYVAVIPAADVVAPTLAYSIELERTDGVRVAAF